MTLGQVEDRKDQSKLNTVSWPTLAYVLLNRILELRSVLLLQQANNDIVVMSNWLFISSWLWVVCLICRCCTSWSCYRIRKKAVPASLQFQSFCLHTLCSASAYRMSPVPDCATQRSFPLMRKVKAWQQVSSFPYFHAILCANVCCLAVSWVKMHSVDAF